MCVKLTTRLIIIIIQYGLEEIPREQCVVGRRMWGSPSYNSVTFSESEHAWF